jgi:hypothetical protein
MHDGRRNVVASAALLERFAAQFQYDTFISGRFRLHDRPKIKQDSPIFGKQNGVVADLWAALWARANHLSATLHRAKRLQ